MSIQYCEYCDKAFDTEDDTCPDCGAHLRELQPGEAPENMLSVEEMLLLGLL